MKIYQVSELTVSLKNLIEESYPELWVEGEISNFRRQSSGHCYFSLKDAQAQLGAVLFRGDGGRLKFRPEDGLAVLCHGRLSLYPPHGKYQMIVDHLEPKGAGALQVAFEQLKKKLEAEGLFAAERKRPLPRYPQRIGLVTSPTGAAIRDLLQVLTRRWPNLQILLYPARVQGDGAAAEIATAIAELNRPEWELDLLIVGRGGGSIEDLWAFNEESVARAIVSSHLPVISAVGHETDFTIADFVADLRAPTPSAAAELAVPLRDDLLAEIARQRDDLRIGIDNRLEVARLHLRHAVRGLRDPRRTVEEALLRTDHAAQRLLTVMEHQRARRQQHLVHLRDQLNSLNPLAILARGYAVALPHGTRRPLRAAADVEPGAAVDILLSQGSLETRITKRLLP